MSNILLNPVFTALDDAGRPLAGAVLSFFLSGTTTPTPVYSDAALNTELGTTVTADSAGVFPAIYYDPQVALRIQLHTAAGVLRWDVDPYECACADPPVHLTDHTVLGQDNSTVYAGLMLGDDGVLYLVTTAEDHTPLYTPVEGEWLTGEGSFEARLTITSGDGVFGSGTEDPDVWLSLDQDRTWWNRHNVSAPFTEQGEWLLEIRDADTEIVLAAATFDVTCEGTE